MLCVVKDKVRNDNFDQNDQFIERLVIFKSDFVLLSNITCKVADILVTPRSEVLFVSLQKVVKTGSGPLFAEDH